MTTRCSLVGLRRLSARLWNTTFSSSCADHHSRRVPSWGASSAPTSSALAVKPGAGQHQFDKGIKGDAFCCGHLRDEARSRHPWDGVHFQKPALLTGDIALEVDAGDAAATQRAQRESAKLFEAIVERTFRQRVVARLLALVLGIVVIKRLCGRDLNRAQAVTSEKAHGVFGCFNEGLDEQRGRRVLRHMDAKIAQRTDQLDSLAADSDAEAAARVVELRNNRKFEPGALNSLD